jgi:hypothetical protein
VLAGVLLLGWVTAWPLGAAVPGQTSIDDLLRRVGDRLGDYYQRMASVVCTETATVQPIGRDWTPDGMARTVESELRIEATDADGQPLPEARVVRDIRRVNGRAPRERDLTDRTGCTDPDPLSSEPLAFLLPAHQHEYDFTGIERGRERDRDAWVLSFASKTRGGRVELVEDPRGHADCFDWTGPVAVKGRVWIDAATAEVLRVDRYNQGPVDVRVPRALQRRYNFDTYVTLDRDEISIRYEEVAFTEPSEVLLLPRSIDEVTVIRNGLQSVRRTTRFSDYRRFLTAGRIKRTTGGAPTPSR